MGVWRRTVGASGRGGDGTVTADDRSADNWAGRTVLITGSNGFLGGRLARALCLRSARVLGLMLPGTKPMLNGGEVRGELGIEPMFGDIRDIATLAAIFRDHEVAVVFHMAAFASPVRAHDDPRLAFEVNARGTWNLLEAARTAAVVPRVVLASTDSVYGESDGSPFTETMQIAPNFPYEASKACAEIAAHCYFATFGLQVAIARFCNIYGPGDLTQTRLIVSTIQAALSGRPQVLRGDGSAMRNYLYVDDAVAALLGFAEALGRAEFAGRVINFCDETPYSVLDIVSRVLDQTGQPDLAPILGAGKPGEISIMLASAAKARQLLNWQPAIRLDEGLRRTIAWHRERQSRVEGA